MQADTIYKKKTVYIYKYIHRFQVKIAQKKKKKLNPNIAHRHWYLADPRHLSCESLNVRLFSLKSFPGHKQGKVRVLPKQKRKQNTAITKAKETK